MSKNPIAHDMSTHTVMHQLMATFRTGHETISQFGHMMIVLEGSWTESIFHYYSVLQDE